MRVTRFARTTVLLIVVMVVAASPPDRPPPSLPDPRAEAREAVLVDEVVDDGPLEPSDPSEYAATGSVAPVGSVPTAIFLPSTSAYILPVGINPDGSMEIPERVDEVGWYTLTNVRPGDPGTAVLAGHVNSRYQGRGVFYELAELRPGDEIRLATGDGVQHWIVTHLESHRRSELPIADIFSLDGDPRLVLVTCGGEFEEDLRSFRDNVVVYATQSLLPAG